jgi:hypothetical protein
MSYNDDVIDYVAAQEAALRVKRFVENNCPGARVLRVLEVRETYFSAAKVTITFEARAHVYGTGVRKFHLELDTAHNLQLLD